MSNTYTVNTKEALYGALSQASGGDVIYLAEGNYDRVNLLGYNFDEPVKLVSQNESSPAIFTNKTRIRDTNNLEIENVNFKVTDVADQHPDSAYNSLIYINNSSNVTIRNSEIEGKIVEAEPGQSIKDINPNGTIVGYATGSGVALYNTNGVVFENNDFHTLKHGISFGSAENTLITGNEIHNIRVDGIRGTDHHNTTIEGNSFHSFNRYIKDEANPNGRTDDHSDMIQYWLVRGETGISNFKISNNLFMQTDGETQTIFGHGSLRGMEPDGIELTGFEITNNVILNGHSHGITLNDVNGAQVEDNILLANHRVLDSYSNAPRINIGNSENLDVDNNVSLYSWDRAIRSSGDNYRDPSDDGVYQERNISITDTVFLSSKESSSEFVHNYFKGLENKDLSVDELQSIIKQGLVSLSIEGRFKDTVQSVFEGLPANGGGASPDTPADIDYADVILAEGYTRGRDSADIYKFDDEYGDVIGGEQGDLFDINDLVEGHKFHRIRDFNTSEDILDMSDVLGNYDAAIDDINNFLNLEEVTWNGKTHTILEVDQNGQANWQRGVMLSEQNDLNVSEMLADGSLIV